MKKIIMAKWVNMDVDQKRRLLVIAIFFVFISWFLWVSYGRRTIFLINHYYEYRNDLNFARFQDANLDIAGNSLCKDGYVTQLRMYPRSLTKDYIAEFNKLQRLHTVRLYCRKITENDKPFLANINLIENISELQIEYDDVGVLAYMTLPDCVTTVRMKGNDQPDDEELMLLVKFENVKEVLAYCKKITAKGVEEFKKKRPDVRVWWSEDINEERRRKDLGPSTFEDYPEYLYPLQEYRSKTDVLIAHQTIFGN